MSTPTIKQLDGHDGYLRWKESMLLRLHALSIAHVLSEDPRAAAGDDSAATAKKAAKKWAGDDALCRGVILATISDRLLLDYARFATAAELWRALARTYDVEALPVRAMDMFDDFSFDEGGPLLLLEQIAHAQALGAAANFPDGYVAHVLCGKLPEAVSNAVIMRCGSEMDMDVVWDVARRVAKTGVPPERLWGRTPMYSSDQDEAGSYI